MSDFKLIENQKIWEAFKRVKEESIQMGFYQEYELQEYKNIMIELEEISKGTLDNNNVKYIKKMKQNKKIIKSFYTTCTMNKILGLNYDMCVYLFPKSLRKYLYVA